MKKQKGHTKLASGGHWPKTKDSPRCLIAVSAERLAEILIGQIDSQKKLKK